MRTCVGCCRESQVTAGKSESMPPSLDMNGVGLQTDHIIPIPRPAFGQVQDTALQHDATVGVSQAHMQRVVTSNSLDQPASVSSTGNSTFASGHPTIERSSFEHASEISPVVGPSLSDGIPPVFETNSSCGASASALAPIPGQRFNINLTTGKPAPSLLPAFFPAIFQVKQCSGCVCICNNKSTEGYPVCLDMRPCVRTKLAT